VGLQRRDPSAAIWRSRPGSFAWPGLVGDGAKRRRGPERRDIVFGKNKILEKSKGRDKLKNRISAAGAVAGAVRRRQFDSAGLARAKRLGVAAKSLISLEIAKENVWNFLGKSLEKLGFSLEILGNPWKNWAASPVRRLTAP